MTDRERYLMRYLAALSRDGAVLADEAALLLLVHEDVARLVERMRWATPDQGGTAWSSAKFLAIDVEDQP